MRRIAADAAETPSKSSERAPPSPPTEFYSGSESGDELRGYDPPHGFGVDVATLRQLCEATHGEGRVARISALGGLDELARRLRADTVSGLATSGLHVVDANARAAAFGVNAVPSRPSKSFVDLLLQALDDDTLRILVACGALSLLLELGFNTDNHNPHALVEGAAILAAVAVVSVVTALNDKQKQAQFEALNAAAAEGYVVRARRGGDECAIGKLILVLVLANSD
jgi:P-type Ca2+ transporter type 2B